MKQFFGACAFAGCLATLAVPAMASQNSYGGYDIAGPYQANESFYAAARGWDVYKAHDVNRNAYCVAINERNDGNTVRIGWDGLQWQVAVPVQSSSDWSGAFEVDGQVFNFASGTAVDSWTIVWIGLPEVDAMKAGSRAVVGAGRADYDFSLAGSNAAMLKVEECVNNGGVAPVAPVAAAPSRPALPAAPPAAPTAARPGQSRCTDAYDQTYACLVTHLSPEPGYSQVMQIDDVAGTIGHTVKIRNDGVGEVWVRLPQAWQGWKFFGYWITSGKDDKCITPGDNQPQEAIDNMGSDSWSLCVN